uniref:Uncharacterized protein n=1 Tax=Opuntia streptacantha TaxID=393608 RepID=A0A7C8YV37_OPUST
MMVLVVVEEVKRKVEARCFRLVKEFESAFTVPSSQSSVVVGWFCGSFVVIGSSMNRVGVGVVWQQVEVMMSLLQDHHPLPGCHCTMERQKSVHSKCFAADNVSWN